MQKESHRWGNDIEVDGGVEECHDKLHSSPIRISPREKRSGGRPISARSSSLIYRKDRSSLNGKNQEDLEWLTHERYAHSIPRSDQPRTNPRRRIDLIRCFLASGTRVKWIRDFSPRSHSWILYRVSPPPPLNDLQRDPKFRHVRQFLESLLFFVVFYRPLFLSPCLSLSLFLSWYRIRGIGIKLTRSLERYNFVRRRSIIRNRENLKKIQENLKKKRKYHEMVEWIYFNRLIYLKLIY